MSNILNNNNKYNINYNYMEDKNISNYESEFYSDGEDAINEYLELNKQGYKFIVYKEASINKFERDENINNDVIGIGSIVYFDNNLRGEIIDIDGYDSFIISRGMKCINVSRENITGLAPKNLNLMFDDGGTIHNDRVSEINSTMFYRYYPMTANPFEVSFDDRNKYGYGIYFLDNPYYYKNKFDNSRLIAIKPNVKNPMIFMTHRNQIPNYEYASALLSAIQHDNVKDRDAFTRKMIEAGYDSLVVVEPRGTYLILFYNDLDLYTVDSDINVEKDEFEKNKISEEEYEKGGGLKANDIPLDSWLQHKTTKVKVKVWNVNPQIGKMQVQDIYGNKDTQWRSASDWKLIAKPTKELKEIKETLEEQEGVSEYSNGGLVKYDKEDVKNIILNEGILYAVKDFIDEDSISDSETELVVFWMNVRDEIKHFESLMRGIGYEPAYLISNDDNSYSIISDPKGGEYSEIPVSNLSIEAQNIVTKINDLLVKIINYVGLDESDFGTKY